VQKEEQIQEQGQVRRLQEQVEEQVQVQEEPFQRKVRLPLVIPSGLDQTRRF